MTTTTKTTRRPPATIDPRPLLAHLDRHHPDGRATHREAAAALGISFDAVRAWRHGRRRIRLSHADAYATRLGVDSWDLWPELREAVIASITLTCARDICDATFVPKNRVHIYCTPKCKERSAGDRKRTLRQAKGHERTCAAEGCTATFVAVRLDHRYCSANCSWRHRYRTNEAFAATRRAHAARYYEYIRAARQRRTSREQAA